MKIIDTHCHVYPDKIADKAANATGVFYGIPPHFNGSVGKLLERGEKAGISHYVVSSIATTPAQVHAINTFISSIVEFDGNKFTGLGTLHQDTEDVESAVEEIISLGLKGIKLHPDIQHVKLNDERVLRFFEIIGERLPVLVHFGDKRYDNSNPKEAKPVLDAFPHVRFIGAHFGGWSIWKEASYELYKYDNLMVDCSSSLYATTPEEATELIRLYGAGRVMFGSDYPLFDPFEEVQRFNKLKLTEDETEKILYKNAEALYGIKI